MLNPINATASAAIVQAATAKPAPSGAQAQLAKLQTDLSDWVHCASCNTPEGQAKIADITAKIQDLQKNMQSAADARQAAQQAAKQASETPKSSNIQSPGANSSNSTSGTGAGPANLTSALGQNVDEFV